MYRHTHTALARLASGPTIYARYPHGTLVTDTKVFRSTFDVHELRMPTTCRHTKSYPGGADLSMSQHFGRKRSNEGLSLISRTPELLYLFSMAHTVDSVPVRYGQTMLGTHWGCIIHNVE
jgi:hypothetical protein